jgi:hypothetical protein
MAIKISGDTVINDNKLFLPNNSAEVATLLEIVSNEITVNLNAATLFTVNLTSNITNINLTNVQGSGRSSSFVLVFVGDGTARTVIWPISFRWPNNTAPTISSSLNKKDVFVFFTTDGGTSWQAFVSGQEI